MLTRVLQIQKQKLLECDINTIETYVTCIKLHTWDKCYNENDEEMSSSLIKYFNYYLQLYIAIWQGRCLKRIQNKSFFISSDIVSC